MDQSPPLPSWLTGQFLEEHLQNHYVNTQLKIIDYTIKPPSNDGNFASKIFRVHVEFDGAAEVGDDTQAEHRVSVS